MSEQDQQDQQAQPLTLGEAARMLRISRKTLDKWLERLGIEPQRHPYDYRFFTITSDELQRIRQTRAQMPAPASSSLLSRSVIPSYNPPAFGRGESDEGTTRDVSPMAAPMPRQRPLQRAALRTAGAEGLPEGWMSRTDCADLHNFPRTTLRRWCEEGRIETSSETFGGEHGMFPTAQPVTARGMRQFYALASGRPDFQRCPLCPHADAAAVADVSSADSGEDGR